MTYLLDTNVVSEWVKPQPDANVMTWFGDVGEDQLFLSVATFAEIRRGIESLSPSRRRNRLEQWLHDDLATRFADRLLVIDRRVAEAWGVVTARGRRLGLPLGPMDGFFAATAEVHGLTLATRNVSEFTPLGIPVVNPWEPLS